MCGTCLLNRLDRYASPHGSAAQSIFSRPPGRERQPAFNDHQPLMTTRHKQHLVASNKIQNVKTASTPYVADLTFATLVEVGHGV
ncbi:hypothetical protein B0T26DRAFT_699529 [Lasiosphaeria miniovina]|uniref:Uncharacterized protein n=1 Tax=Lasiosphaeria miniovina TaxID=1954250 RepID=A0AA40B705_9PEZI|nr:uncharacterized protein B0T26DRAFT_699529 [Lasiosphaeria miniovina]KAK0728863.1 hypothetical protein B0T26DRAFT_699529 [Lasiosphaeria miniovina]